MATPGIAARRAARDAKQKGSDVADLGDDDTDKIKNGVSEAELRNPGGDVVMVPDSGDFEEEDLGDLHVEEDATKQREKKEEDHRSPYDERLGVDDDDDAPGGRQRSGHRSRRNAARRRQREEADATIAALTGKIDHLERLLGGVANGQIGLARNSLQQQLTNAQTALRMAETELAKAYEAQDGKMIVELQGLRDEARSRVTQLEGAAERFAQGGGTQPNGNGQQRQQQQRQPDPELRRRAERAREYSEIFADRFGWFDPDSRDADSRLVIALDAQVEEDGYLPHTKAYWEELERRLVARGLKPDDEDGEEDEEEEKSRRRAPAQKRRGGPPTGAVRSGQSNPGVAKGNDALPRALVDSLREMGLVGGTLSDDDKKKRDRIIKRYRDNVAAEKAARS